MAGGGKHNTVNKLNYSTIDVIRIIGTQEYNVCGDGVRINCECHHSKIYAHSIYPVWVHKFYANASTLIV